MPLWSKEQKTAINFRDGSAIVSAAAGSGKTAVLVERVKQIICDEKNPVPADELAIMTFTNKAADELRQRLMNEVADLGDTPYIREQIIRLESADISTISSFCLNIVREFATTAGLTPSFSVLDTSEVQAMRVTALERTMERLHAEFSDREILLLHKYFAETDDSGIENAVTGLYDFTRNLPDIKGFLKRHESTTSRRPAKKAAKYLRELAEDCVIKVKVAAMGMVDSAESEKMSDYCMQFADLAHRLVDIDIFDPDNITELYDITSFKPDGKMPTEKGEYSGGVKLMRELFTESLEKLGLLLPLIRNAEDDLQRTAPAAAALIKLMRVFESEYSGLKRAADGVDFSDLEQLTLTLTEDESIRKKLRSRFRYIIVDEFQDSNDVQYEIFHRISDNGENLFFVGDIKQSIYRFRGANPDVFTYCMAGRSYKNIYMSKNFRSNRHVIKAVNGIFESVMTADCGGARYSASARLYEAAREIYRESDADKGNTAELILLDNVSEQDYIAARIAEMLNEGFLVTDKRTGERRPCRVDDFAIIMRSDTSRAHIYREALARYGIPARAKGDAEYTNLAEINLVISLLTVIDNPYNDIAAATVLMSPLYMASAEDMAQIRLASRKSLYSGVIASAEKVPAAKRFLADYRRYRKLMTDSSVTELVRTIYDDGALIAAVSLRYKGEQCVANIRKLFGYTEKFSQNGGGTLSDFLAFFEKTKKNSLQLTPGVTDTGLKNVTIMSIHASKGLEYPICFVAEAHRHFNFTDSWGRVLFDMDLGIGIVDIDEEKAAIIETALHKAISEKISAATVSEEMRLLYVALTRAREKLIITAETKENKNGTVKIPKNSFLEWIDSSAAVGKKVLTAERVRSLAGLPLPEADSESEEEACADPETVERIKSALGGEYAYSALCSIPAKFTATELGVEHKENILAETTEKVSVFPRKPSFLLPEKNLTGKKKGDAYHKVMELLDFSDKNAKKQLERLHAAGTLTDAEYACIKAAEIQKFLDSDLCGRAVRAEKMYREFPVFGEIPLSYLGVYDIPADCDDKPIVQGIADMFFIEDGKIVLVDYKTNHNVTPAKLIETYKGQLDIYASILSDTFGMPADEAVLYSFELGEVKVEV